MGTLPSKKVQDVRDKVFGPRPSCFNNKSKQNECGIDSHFAYGGNVMEKLNAVNLNFPKIQSKSKDVNLAGLDFGGRSNDELKVLLAKLEAVASDMDMLVKAGSNE